VVTSVEQSQFIKKTLEEEKGELSALEEEVVKSIHEQETVSKNINKEYDVRLTFGERLADQIAMYGESWKSAIFTKNWTTS